MNKPGANEDAHLQQSNIDMPVNGKPGDYDALVATTNSAVAAMAASIATRLQAP